MPTAPVATNPCESVMRHVKRTPYVTLGLALVFLSSCGRRPQQQPGGSEASSAAASRSGTSVDAAAPVPVGAVAVSTTSERDPAAIKALENMGAYLRSLSAFQIRSSTSRD